MNTKHQTFLTHSVIVPMESYRLDFATAPSIVRAHQKDIYLENSVIEGQLLEVLRLFKDASFVHRHTELVKALASCIYLSLTTAAGAKTLGEEYVDLHYVTPSGDRLASKLQRLGFVLSYCGGPRLCSYLFSRMAKSQDLAAPAKLLGLLDFRDLSHLHTALFYFTGNYYDFAKRLFGMRYAIGYKMDPASRQATGNYELLGLVIIIQLLVKYATKLKELAPDQHILETEKKVDGDLVFGVDTVPRSFIDLSDPAQLPYIKESSRSCMLCLCPMVDPCCATCGHIFCWDCIIDWCKEREECPLCRANIKQSQLLPLR